MSGSIGLVVALAASIALAGASWAAADTTTTTTPVSTATSTLAPASTTTIEPTTTTSAPVGPLTVDTPVSGFTTNPDPQVIDSTTPEGDLVHVRLSADTNFYCSLSGTTHFTLDGYLDPATGISTGTMDELFTGTVVGAGTGTLRFAETFTGLADGSFTVDATVISGTADLATVTGTIRFVGHSDPVGVGTGAYTGTLQLPSDPPASAPTVASCPSPAALTAPATPAEPADPVSATPGLTG